MKTVSYLRVSTPDQDTSKNKTDVLLFCNERDFGRVEFVEEKVSGRVSWKERKLKAVLDSLEEGDRLVVPELSRLGRSTLDVLGILHEAKQKGIDVYTVKERLSLNGEEIQGKVLATVLALVGELERDFISARTKEGLRNARASGKRLGRPPGPGKSKLDPHRGEIVRLLKLGVPKNRIAKKLKTSPLNLYHWLKRNNIEVTEHDD